MDSVKDNPLVSIIIPIYNVEEYLVKCIDSALSQTYQEIEIILVDDASTDRSGVIADEYADLSNKIKVVHNKVNKRFASPNRNTGLKIARGDFVCFVDSDDYIDDKWVERLIEGALDTCADVVRGFVSVEIEHDRATEYFGDIDAYREYYNVELRRVVLKNKLNMRSSVCYSLYSKKIIDTHGLRFDEDVLGGEDELWNLQFGYYANKIITTNKPVYYHRRIRTGSIMTTSNLTSDGIYSRVLASKKMLDFMNSKNDYPKQFYLNRFFELHDMTNRALANLSNRKMSEEIGLVLGEIFTDVKYKDEIFARLGSEYVSRQNRSNSLNVLPATKGTESTLFLSVRRYARRLLGDIKRKIKNDNG